MLLGRVELAILVIAVIILLFFAILSLIVVTETIVGILVMLLTIIIALLLREILVSCVQKHLLMLGSHFILRRDSLPIELIGVELYYRGAVTPSWRLDWEALRLVLVITWRLLLLSCAARLMPRSPLACRRSSLLI